MSARIITLTLLFIWFFLFGAMYWVKPDTPSDRRDNLLPRPMSKEDSLLSRVGFDLNNFDNNWRSFQECEQTRHRFCKETIASEEIARRLEYQSMRPSWWSHDGAITVRTCIQESTAPDCQWTGFVVDRGNQVFSVTSREVEFSSPNASPTRPYTVYVIRLPETIVTVEEFALITKILFSRTIE